MLGGARGFVGGISDRSGNIMGALFVPLGSFGQEYRLIGVLSLSREREPPYFPSAFEMKRVLLTWALAETCMSSISTVLAAEKLRGTNWKFLCVSGYSVEMKAHQAHGQVNYTHSCSFILQTGFAVLFWSLEPEETTVKHITGLLNRVTGPYEASN